jgi:hypothetical protein
VVSSREMLIVAMLSESSCLFPDICAACQTSAPEFVAGLRTDFPAHIEERTFSRVLRHWRIKVTYCARCSRIGQLWLIAGGCLFVGALATPYLFPQLAGLRGWVFTIVVGAFGLWIARNPLRPVHLRNFNEDSHRLTLEFRQLDYARKFAQLNGLKENATKNAVFFSDGGHVKA